MSKETLRRRTTTIFDTGGDYDPATDRWHSTKTVDAPTPRTGYTAVWAGDSMIIWGGASGLIDLNTGGRYLPR